MSFDFATIMVLAVLITGAIWLLDIYLLAPARKEKAAQLDAAPATNEEDIEEALKEPLLVEYAKSFFPVILIVLVLRSFLVEPFRIPSGSMIPTLQIGDFILVNKFSYGVRLPVVNTKILDTGSPERGDVAVFRYPRDPSVDYIKRIVGLPGDVVSYRNKEVFINGKKVENKILGVAKSEKTGMQTPGLLVVEEKLEEKYHKLHIEQHKPSYNVEMRVPEGHYFVMGDNRDNSNDSRFWGTVPEENLVGRAFLIWMNWDFNDGGVNWDRLGSSIE